VTVYFTDPEEEAADVSFRHRLEQWNPNVPLITLRSSHRSIAKPIVKYLCDIEAKDKYHKLVVADPGGAAQEVLGLPAVQPAGRDPGSGDQARHGPTWSSAASATGWNSSRPTTRVPPRPARRPLPPPPAARLARSSPGRPLIDPSIVL
jgi:hypothetical protein